MFVFGKFLLPWRGIVAIGLLCASAAAEEAPTPPAYPDHSQLLVLRDAAGKESKIATQADWRTRRAHILLGMQQAMGPLPAEARRVPLDMQITMKEETPKYTRQKITFQAEPGDRVPAWLLLPKGDARKRPAMLCLHQTTTIGKGEPAGQGGLANLHYAHELAERGFVCIVPDYPSFGDYKYDFQAAFKDGRYLSGSMKAIWNNQRAVDLLVGLTNVDGERIGCIGHSLGGHNTLFTAAFDERIKAAVTSCGFTAFHHYYGGKLAGWTSDRYMPRIRDVYGNDPNRVPFDFYGVLAAIAPRGIFVNAPISDGNFEVEGVKKVINKVGDVYQLLGAKPPMAEYPSAGHDFPVPVRTRAYEWLEQVLGKP